MKEVGGRAVVGRTGRTGRAGWVGRTTGCRRSASLLAVESEMGEEREVASSSSRSSRSRPVVSRRSGRSSSSGIASTGSLTPRPHRKSAPPANRPSSSRSPLPRPTPTSLHHGLAEHARHGHLRRGRLARLSPASQELVRPVCVPSHCPTSGRAALTSSARPSRSLLLAGKCLCCPCYLICGVALSRGASSSIKRPSPSSSCRS